MAISELVVKLRNIIELDETIHLFCKDEHRKRDAVQCLQILGFDGPDAILWHSKLKQKYDRQLGRCEKCILEYHRGRQAFVEELRNEFEDEDVERFASILDDRDSERIQNGLDSMKQTLLSLPKSERKQGAVSLSDLFAMFEALTCDGFLTNPHLLRSTFEEPFSLVQTNKALKILHWVPALMRFLFDDHKIRSSWAAQNWSKIVKPLTRDDFDFAIRGPLSESLRSELANGMTPESCLKLWSCLQKIVERLDGDLITHSLRAMEQDIYRLALDHMQLDSSGFIPLLQTVRLLLSKGPKDFWDAMGPIAPTTVIEQIFSAPRFNSAISFANSNEQIDDLDALLSWIEPFLDSLQTSHKPQACRSLTSLLMNRLQNPHYPTFMRDRCYRVGLKVIFRTLMECCEARYQFDSVGRIVALDTLNITLEHMDEILSVIKGKKQAENQDELLSACFTTIKYALKLECNIVRTDRVKIHGGDTLSPGFEPFRPRVWPAIERGFIQGNLTLARICIEETSELTGLESLESKKESELPHPKERKMFGTVLRSFSETISNILEKINDLSIQDLKRMTEEQGMVTKLVRVLFSAEQDIQNAGIDLLKTMSGLSFRKEAIGYVLQLGYDQVLEAFLSVMSRVSKIKSFACCGRMLKLGTDIVDVLCDPQDGILRLQSLSSKSLAVTQQFWKSLWQTLRTIYNSTREWEFHIRTAIMTDFCRDVMQFSEHLFEQFATFDAALEPLANGSNNSGHPALPGDDGRSWTSLLLPPSETLEAIFLYLRLRDEYLLSTCVNLTRKALLKLTSKKMQISQNIGDKLEGIVAPSSKVTTNLSGQQKAEIRRALEENLGRSIFEVHEGRSGTSTPEVDFVHSKTTGLRAKQGTIDLNKWSSRAKSIGEASRDSVVVSSEATNKAQPSGRKPSFKPVTDTKLPKRAQQLLVTQKSLSKGSQQAQDANKDAFLKERQKLQQEKKLRDAQAVAKLKKQPLPNSIADITAGEGSALGNIGNIGKEHVKKSSEIMVSSGSESDSDSEASSGDPVFAPLTKTKPSTAVSDYNSSRLQRLSHQQPVKKTKQIRSKKDLRARVAPNLSQLHEDILRWNFFHDGDFPPGSSRKDYSMVASEFRTPLEYQNTFKPLLLLEAWQSFRQAQEEATGKSFQINISNRMTDGNLFEVTSTMEATPDSDKKIFEGDIVLLSKSPTPSQSPDQPNSLARVFKVTRKQNSLEMTFRVAQGTKLLDNLVPRAVLKGEKITSLIPLEREYGALQGLVYYDLCEEITKAHPSPLLRYNDGILDKLIKCYDLNRAQAKAVQSAVDNDAFTLIQGPPGSGKTKTIVAIVGALLTSSLASSPITSISVPSTSNSEKRTAVAKKLLVCAPSNAAVDELVMRFMQGIKTSAGDFRKPSVVRLGKSESINPKVMEVTLDELVEKKMNAAVAASNNSGEDETHKTMMDHKATCDKLNSLRTILDEQDKKGQTANPEQKNQLEHLKRRKQQLSNKIDQLKDKGNSSARDFELRRNHVRQDIIDGAHILCATLSGSGHDMFRNLNLDFGTVVIDEAAQSIELSALIPLKYGCSKCIMVGDPKQLPPTVLSREASRFQYEQSLFVRMQANDPENVHLLDTQYRMHPDISAFPSRAFYEGRLHDGPSMASLRQKPWHIDNLLSPYRFFDVQGMHQSAPKGHSLVNVAEIDIALKLFRRLKDCASGYDFQGKIGIITPYKSQLAMLRDRFKKVHGADITKTIEFNTTDAFQGRESEVIIFSCVRASNTGIGFLSDIRRMNVGITRAKSSLWVLGNANSLMQGEYWSKLIQDSRTRGRYTSDVLKVIAQPPQRVDVRANWNHKTGQETLEPQIQDIEMTDAPSLDANTESDAVRMDVIDESASDTVVRNRKRSPPSPTKSSHDLKRPRKTSLSEDTKRPPENVPLVSSPAAPDNVKSEANTTVKAQKAEHAADGRGVGLNAKASRPMKPIKGQDDDAALIKPKRRPGR